MLISLCIPCHNRTHDLKNTLPMILASANASPPVEIVIVDYNSPDDLRQYVDSIMHYPLDEDVSIVYRKYTGRDHYHMAHARNLGIRLASGEYITILSADIAPSPLYLPQVRDMLEPYRLIYVKDYRGVITVKRDHLIGTGGYDERFEFYGSEDTELHERLVRRGLVEYYLEPDTLHVIKTPNDVKVANYRLPLSKRDMHEAGRVVLEESREKMAMIANPEGWGAWT